METIYTTTNPAPQKLALIQMFRGIAAIVVLFYHTSTLYAINLNYSILDNSFKFGKAGVDFFFVLSGFIIYTVHKKDLGVREKLAYFLGKRFIRIYPLYWLILTLKIVVKSLGILSVISAVLLFPYPSPPVLNVSWTLSYEVFFYVCFGLLIYFRAPWLRYFFIGCAGIILLYWGSYLVQAGVPVLSPLYCFLVSAHHLEFLLGILAANLVSKSIGANARYWCLGLGLLLFALAAVYTVWDVNRMAIQQSISLVARAEFLKTITEYHSYLFFGVPSFLIMLGSAFIDRFDRWAVPGVLLFFGDASYALYLTHSSLINAITLGIAKRWQYDLGSTVIPTMLVSLAVGCLVHKYIESPVLSYLNQRINRLKVENPVFKAA